MGAFASFCLWGVPGPAGNVLNTVSDFSRHTAPPPWNRTAPFGMLHVSAPASLYLSPPLILLYGETMFLADAHRLWMARNAIAKYLVMVPEGMAGS